MTLVFVQRNPETGAVKGVYLYPQPQPDGSSLTEADPLPEDHPDVVAFRAAFQSAG